MPAGIDIIILSYGRGQQLQDLTIQCVESLLKSEDPQNILFNVVVIESNSYLAPYQYNGTKTIYPDTEFGYNKYMNIGIRMTDNPYICLCNNDLIFHNGWASEILKAFSEHPELASANPYCQNFQYDDRIIKGANVIRRDKNLNINGILTGWCIFVKRSVFKKIGLLDERFTFWFADNDYDLTLRTHRVKHALVKSSVVDHLGSQSHDLLLDKRDELTIGQRAVFEKKWLKESIITKILRASLKKLKQVETYFK